MVWHSQKHEGARSAPTLNSMVREARLACSPWLGSGQPKRKSFCALAAKAQSAPHFIKFQAQAAWLCKWSSILWCASAATFSQPLLAVSGRLEADGTIPSVYERVCVLFRSSFVNVAYVCYVCLSCRSRLEKIFGAPSHHPFAKSHLLLRFNLHAALFFAPQSPLRQTYHVDAATL